MEKNIKDYLHLYLGCEVEYLDLYSNKRCIDKLIGLSDEHFFFVQSSNEGQEIGYAKPILRPLSDMSDEEAGVIFQIHRNNSEDFIGQDFYIQKQDHGFIITRLDLMELHLMISFKSGELYTVADVPKQRIESVRNVWHITKFLLSKHFDLFGLIEAGLAIDKTTLSPKN